MRGTSVSKGKCHYRKQDHTYTYDVFMADSSDITPDYKSRRSSAENWTCQVMEQLRMSNSILIQLNSRGVSMYSSPCSQPGEPVEKATMRPRGSTTSNSVVYIIARGFMVLSKSENT